VGMQLESAVECGMCQIGVWYPIPYTLGMADPGIVDTGRGGPWEWGTLKVAYPNRPWVILAFSIPNYFYYFLHRYGHGYD